MVKPTPAAATEIQPIIKSQRPRKHRKKQPPLFEHPFFKKKMALDLPYHPKDPFILKGIARISRTQVVAR